jgi:predicted metal-dependent phosphoesterase TrpH
MALGDALTTGSTGVPRPDDPTTALVDLHCHSSASNGAMGTPMAVAAYMRRAGYAAFALTEHDNVRSLDAAMECARQEGLEYLAGVELTVRVDEPGLGGEVAHVLGYGYRLTRALADLAQAAMHRHVTELTGLLGRLRRKRIADITLEEMCAYVPQRFGADDRWKSPYEVGIIGDLLKRRGAIPAEANGNDAVRRLIREHCGDMLLPPVPSAAEACAALQEAGAVRILAHPFTADTVACDSERRRIEAWLERFVDGVEVFRPYANPAYEAMLKEVLVRRRRPFTGGSDTHSYVAPVSKVSHAPYVCLESLREFRSTGRVIDAFAAVMRERPGAPGSP